MFAGVAASQSVIKHVFHEIPKSGLKLLVDPKRQILNSVAGYEVLGDNVVVNGDFHDFTMDNDANTVGHWIFDDVYDAENGGIGYIGQDWKGTSIGNNITVNGGGEGSTDWVDSNGDNIPDNWIKAGGDNGYPEIITENGNRFVRINNTSGSYSGLMQSPVPYVAGKTYILKYKYRSNGAHGVELVNPGAYPFGSRIPSSNGEWKVFVGAFYASNNARFTFQTWDKDTYLDVDDVNLYEVISGNVLCRGSDFLVEDQIVGSNPSYKNGHALEHDGINDYFYIPASQANAFNFGSGDFTVEFWMKTNDYTAINAEKSIINKYAGSYSGWRIEFGSGANIWFKASGNGSSWEVRDIAYKLQDNNWHHYAFVVDRTNSKVDIYVDGLLVSTLTISGSSSWDESSKGLYIAKQSWTSIYSPNMQLGEIRISNIARTEQEIKNSYGLAKGWTWHQPVGGTGYGINNNFQEEANTTNFSEGLTQSVNVNDGMLYKFEGDVTYISGDKPRTWDSETGRIDYYDNLQPNESFHFVRYFKASGSSAQIHLKSRGSGVNVWDNISVRPVLNASQILNLVEDYSKGGAVYTTIVDDMGSLSDWGPYDWGSDGTWSQPDGYDGYLECSKPTDYSRIYKNVNIENGAIYYFRFKVYKVSGVGGYSTNAATDIPGFPLTENSNPPIGQWVVEEGYFKATASGTYKFGIRGGWYDGSTPLVLRFDDFVLKKVSNGNHGLMRGNMEANQPAHSTAFFLDGVDDYANFGNVCNPGANDFILFSWIKSDKTVGATIWGKYNGGSADWMLRYTDNGAQVAKITFYWDSNQLDYYTSADYSQFRFVAIAVLRSRNEVKIYIDGEEQTVTKRGTFNLSDVPPLSNSLSLGFGSLHGDAASQVAEDHVGISGIYIFDGQDWAPSSTPLGYEDVVAKRIYNTTKKYYQK